VTVGRWKADSPLSMAKVMEVEVAGLGAGVPNVGRAAPFRTIWHGAQSNPLASAGWECGSPL
jgi:hypothetical protein